MTEGYVYIIAYVERDLFPKYIRTKRDRYEGKFTSDIEDAKQFMSRTEAKELIHALSRGWWDRLWHWRIRKVPVSIFE